MQLWGATMKINVQSGGIQATFPVLRTLITDSPIAVGLVAVAINGGPFVVPLGLAIEAFSFVLLNSSTAGQNIRIGILPSFVGPAGFLLTPGSVIVVDNLSTTGLLAIADAANGRLERFITRP
jgi:hypothetical protein